MKYCKVCRPIFEQGVIIPSVFSHMVLQKVPPQPFSSRTYQDRDSSSPALNSQIQSFGQTQSASRVFLFP